MNRASAFTLIEILAASLASAILLLGLYGIFHRAIKTRDAATERIQLTHQRERAAAVLRDDLRNAYLSGGLFACTLEGGLSNQKSRFPGYLRFTATTGKETNGETYGDVQQIEYYISDAADRGPLVRALTRNLLDTQTQESTLEEPILQNVERFEVAFYDGLNWQEAWQVTGSSGLASSLTGTSTALSGSNSFPQAVRLRVIQTAAADRAPVPPPLEILVPFTSEPFVTSTSTTGT